MTLPETWYKSTRADARAPRAALAGPVDCDCAIVGGGLAGLTTALTLVREGRSVVLLEAEETGFGASGRNGGFVSRGYALGAEAIARTVGPDTAAKLQDLSVEGVARVRREIATLAMPGVDSFPGMLSLLRHDDGGAMRDAMQKEPTDGLSYLSRDDLREMLVTSRYFHGRRDVHAFHMHPLNYLRGLAQEFERLGGRIYDQSAVLRAELAGAEKRLHTAQGVVQARQVAFTTGGYTGALVPALARAFLPIWTYVMVSEPNSGLIATAIRTPEALLDSRRAGDYYRLVDGGRRLLWGGRITTRTDSPAEVVRQLRHEMISTYPQLAGLRTELAWSGKMSYARHKMPQIGQLQAGVWYATAFGGHGLNTTAIAGQVVAESMLGASDRINLFKAFGLNWTAGRLGLAAAQLTYWALQAQDKWAERRADRLSA